MQEIKNKNGSPPQQSQPTCPAYDKLSQEVNMEILLHTQVEKFEKMCQENLEKMDTKFKVLEERLSKLEEIVYEEKKPVVSLNSISNRFETSNL